MTPLEHWRSTQRQTPTGAVESAQEAYVEGSVVQTTDEGARRLGGLYWWTVERATAGLVQPCVLPGGLELRLFGRGPRLLAFGPPQLTAVNGRVECRYPITGGRLARYPAGAITFAQRTDGAVSVSSTITGFYPSLAAKPGRPHWTGALYAHVQSRLHVAISRRYFKNLVRYRP